MKTRRNKKGFTIVELVIVIAVIGILTAILVPVFINLTNKANEASDDSLVKNLNTAMAMEEGEGKTNNTYNDAIEYLDNYGYKLANLATKAGNDLLWNSKTNRFLLNEESEYVADKNATGAKDVDYWTIKDNIPVGNNFSIYAGLGWDDAAAVELTGIGFDAGDHAITSISYNGASQNVVIRTNSANTNLTINAKDDTVNHYGVVGKVDAQKIDMNCYNEYGKASYIKVTEGKVVAKDGSKIDVVFANNTDSSKVAVAKESTGKIEKGLTTVQVVSDDNYTNYEVLLEYSADGVNTYTAEDIESIGELSVASDTGVQPQGMDYTAIVNYVGYNSLYEAIVAANAGDTVSLLKDEQKNIEAGTIKYCSLNPSTPKAAVLIDKSITINGFGHTFKTTLAVAIGISSSNVSVNIYDLIINAATSAVQLSEDITDVIINIDGSELDTGSSGYAFRTGNGTKDLDITISNSTLEGYSAITLRNSNSKIEIVNCDLRGKNEASAGATNNYAAIVFDGAAYAGHYSSTSPYHDTPGICGSNNTMVIINTKLSATTATSNSQVWLNMQYGAQNNTVNVDSLSIINPDATWHSTDEGQNNTVKINGATIDATIGD